MADLVSSRLRERWQREQFDPTWLGLFINPFFFARRGLMRELRPLLAQLDGEVLDVGCGRKPYRPFVPASRYVGLDIDSPVTRSLAAADVFYDGRHFPFPNATFDAALCSQVFEHVFWPVDFLAEIHRVLRPGGRLVLTVPFAWDEHEQPWDFARYSSFGIRAVLENAGFEVLEQRKSVADLRALVQLFSGWIFKVTRSRSRVLRLLAQLTMIAPVNLAGVVVAAVLPGNEDFYLDNVVVARRRARTA
jgi:SAM-dependent methyltransferase